MITIDKYGKFNVSFLFSHFLKMTKVSKEAFQQNCNSGSQHVCQVFSPAIFATLLHSHYLHLFLFTNISTIPYCYLVLPKYEVTIKPPPYLLRSMKKVPVTICAK